MYEYKMLKSLSHSRKHGALRASFVTTLAILSQLCSYGFADPRPAPRARPAMPAHFDRATVQQLVDEVEKQHNATVLRAGYFMRRGKVEFPQREGLDLLRTAIDKETVSTKRWFTLQSTLGFASLRVPGASSRDGIAAYGIIFDRAGEAAKVSASYQLNQALSDFVFSVIGRLNDLHLSQDSRTREVLLKAWSAYVTTDVGSKTERREPDWSRAIIKADAESLFLPHIEKQLADPTVIRTYGFLKTAAALLESENPQRAVELLREAQPLLAKNDTEESADLHNRIVDLLVHENRLPEAILGQQEYVKLSGRGHAKLAKLHLQNKDKVAFDIVIQSLSSTDANECEINELAESLLEISPATETSNAEAVECAIKLLGGYLNASRERNAEQELRARKALGKLFLGQKKYQEALKALDISNVKPPLATPRARTYAADIKRLQTGLEGLTK